MLRTPPGINKRDVSSKSIDEAGAVFDLLYKRYVNTENIQKQAENYLLKSLYNKTVSKQKAGAPDSADCTTRLPGSPHPSAQTPKVPEGPSTSKLVDYYQNLPERSKGSAADNARLPSGKFNHKVSFEDQQPRSLGSLNSFNVSSSTLTAPLAEASDAPSPNGTVASQTSPLANSSGSDDLSDVSEDIQSNRNYIRIQKLPLEDPNTDNSGLNSFVVGRNGGDTTEDALQEVDDYFTAPSTSKRYTRYFSNISSKRKDSIYVSTVCILLQSTLFVCMLTGFLFLNSYIINSPVKGDGSTETTEAAAGAAGNSPGGGPNSSGGEAKGEAGLRGSKAPGNDNLLPNSNGAGSNSLNSSLKEIIPLRNLFVNVSFPFLLHFLLFYAVFHCADNYLRSKQLLYTNDVNLEVTTRRLNREMAFSKLSLVTFWFDKALLVLAVLIACFPFGGTYNLKLWSHTEYIYMVLVFAFFFLHVLYSLYYFNFKFVELVFSRKSRRSDSQY